MMRLLLRKWWVILLQGILLVLLSVYIFNNPAIVLAGISFWFGLMLIGTGLIGITSWIVADKEEREEMSLIWSVITFALGLLIVFNILAAMKMLTVIFGCWILLTGFWLFKNGWSVKSYHSAGYGMVLIGLLSVLLAVMMIFNIGTGAIAIATLLGLGVLLTGIALILLSFAKKRFAGKIRDKIDALRN
jgi:uncharacterized membrane protein HdeD (DUF308 family)